MATTLDVGELAIIQYGSDTPDTFTFVILTDIDADTEIKFTDKGYDATLDAFVTSEGELSWTPGVDLPAGTVITITAGGGFTATNSTTGAVLGTVTSSGSFSLATAGDSIFAYQGVLTGTSADAGLIYGINFGDDVASNPLDANGWNTLLLANDANESNLPDELNPALNGGINASYGNPAEIDNGYYNGITQGTPAQILAAIANPANWVTNDATSPTETYPVFGPDLMPVLENVETTILSYDELAGPQVITNTITLDDNEPNFEGATLSLTAGYDTNNDGLLFTDANGITGNYDSTNGILTLTGTATVAQYQAAIRSVTYVNAFYTESTATRTVTITVTDGVNTSVAGTRDIDFVIENTVDGTAGANTLRGGFGTDVINGLAGNDRLYGQDGDDTLNGGEGNDRLVGGDGADVLNGGAGIDGAFYSGATAGVTLNLATGGTGGVADGDSYISIERVYGSNFDDDITGDATDNLINGLGGMDTINGEAGDDTLYGFDGVDELNGGDGTDRLFGGADDDTINGDAGNDFIYGEAGNDMLFGGLDNDFISGGAGNDDINGQGGDDRLIAGAGDDTVMGGAGDDVISAQSGINNLFGEDGNDTFIAGTGDDFFDGGAGIDRVVYSTSFESVIVSLEEDVGIGGTATGDTYANVETLYGSDFDDSLTGDANNNTLVGLDGADDLIGGGGSDRLIGSEGDDSLTGGTGNDKLIGGVGADEFIFGGDHGADRIYDFEQGVDMITYFAAGLNDFSELTITQTGVHVLITSAAGTIAVNNALVSDFDASDFNFVNVVGMEEMAIAPIDDGLLF